MLASTAIWRYRHDNEWVEYALDISRKIEAAFSAFWSSGDGSPVVSLPVAEQDQCSIDLRTLEQISTAADGSMQRCIVCRQDPELATSGFLMNEQDIEWGYAQDPVRNLGFAPYDTATSLLLESGYALYKAGAGLKGIVFTAGNGCDYLVDFVKYQQTRMATRRVRYIYRHSIMPGVRMGVEIGVEAPEVRAADAVAQVLGALCDACPQQIEVIQKRLADRSTHLPLSGRSTRCSDTCSIGSQDAGCIRENASETNRTRQCILKELHVMKEQQCPPPSLPLVAASAMQSNPGSNVTAQDIAPEIRTRGFFACMAGLVSFCAFRRYQQCSQRVANTREVRI